MTRALDGLRINAYRSLRALDIERLGRVSLFVGGNNTGKTSVLEAIGLAARPMDPGQWLQTATNRDSSGPLVDGLWALFPASKALTLETGEETSAPVDIHASFRGADRRMTAHATAFVEASLDIERAEAQTEALVRVRVKVTDKGGAAHEHDMDFRSTPRRVSVGYGVTHVSVFTVTPITHRSTRQLIAHLSHVIDAGAKEKSVELLRMFDPDVADVVISQPFGRDAIRIIHKKHGVVDLATFGDGMRRAFAMSVALTRASGGLLLIDEIESTIHTRMLGAVLPWLARAASEADVQILTTTHSLEAIDTMLTAFADAPPDEVVTYYLRRTEDGHLCRRYDLTGLRELREEGLDIR